MIDLKYYELLETMNGKRDELNKTSRNITSGLVVLLLGIVLIAFGLIWVGAGACLLGGLTALGNWTNKNQLEAEMVNIDQAMTDRWNQLEAERRAR